MNDSTTYLLQRNWILRYRPGQNISSPLVIAFHGWTGNEESMFTFNSQIPDSYAIFAPRGPIRAEPFGYGWVTLSATAKEWDLLTTQVMFEIEEWIRFFSLSPQYIVLIGFSQGAALIYNLCLANPNRFCKAAALAGFLPSYLQGRITKKDLHALHLFIAHGSNDEVVSIENAKQAVQLFQAARASVFFCESESGHKLGSGCLKGFSDFLSTPL